MPPNPFEYNRPTSPERLVGRGSLVGEIVDELLTGSNSFAVLGGRRCGKSSTLHAVCAELLRLRSLASAHERRALPVLASLQQLSDAQRESAEGVLHLLYRELRRSLERDPWCQALGLATPAPTGNAEALALLRDAVVDAAAEAARAGVAVRVVLLVDELTCALGHPWTETLFENLRHLVYDSAAANDLALVVAGTPRCLDTRERGSPFFNVLEVRDLDPLDEAPLRQLAAVAPGFEESTLAWVLAACGGSPYLAQYLLHHALRHTTRTAAQHLDHARRERDRELMSWWMGVGAVGRRIYRELARDDGWRSSEHLAEVSGFTLAEVDRALRLLRLHHAVRGRSDGAEHRAEGDLFRAWVGLQGVVADPTIDGARLLRALLDAYRTLPEWAWLVTMASGRNVHELATGNLEEVAKAVVACALRDGWLHRLIEVAVEERPEVEALRALLESL